MEIVSIYPHAHYLGKQMHGWAELPDGSKRWLIRIPDWDFNWPQTAILGVGRAEQKAVYEGGRFQPRLIMPLSVSYDHRLIDGATADIFMADLKNTLETWTAAP